MLKSWGGALVVAALVAGPVAAQTVSDAVKPAAKTEANWQNRHKALVDRAKKGGYDVLFIGDSITAGWEGAGKKVWEERFAKWKPVNLGIGGDRTQHVLWRITEGKELEGIDPKVVVLMIGTNNVGANSADEIADGIKAIVASFRQQRPTAKVLLLGVFPRSAKGGKDIKDPVVAADGLQPKVKAINERISKLDDGAHVKYLDIGAKFLDGTGGLPKAIMPDYLHLSGEGYKIWADAITPAVEALLKK